jgi:hypothetical protein
MVNDRPDFAAFAGLGAGQQRHLESEVRGRVGRVSERKRMADLGWGESTTIIL